jgi:peptidoglycan/xylan/chitin deacetylase (PgdA/CDA1 family)
MKAIMYHYVRAADPAMPHFRFLNIGNFRRQLDHFAECRGFVTRSEWEDYIKTGRMPARSGKVLLTFDDAMACHYTHVFPELMDRGLWGIFYVPTGPYSGSGLLDVHRIHLLCGSNEGEDLWRHARSLVTEDLIPHARRAAFREATYTAQINAPGVTEFKRLLNYFVDDAHRGSVIDKIAERVGAVFDPKRFYVPADGLVEMADAGMLIGSHSTTHPVMSKLDKDAQALEISRSVEWISTNIGSQGLRSYCHPYGGFHSFDHHTVAALVANGVDFSFNVEARDIEPSDIGRQPHALPRYDCNLFPHGLAD